MMNGAALAMTLATALLVGPPAAEHTGPIDRAVPQGTTVTNHTVGLVALTARESHLGGRYIVAAVSDTGDVAAVVLTRRGYASCTLTGFVDLAARCLTLTGCGLVQESRCQ